MILRVFLSAIILIGIAGLAFAHAVVVEAYPPVRGSVTGPDVMFRLRFNSRIDASRSVLNLVLPDGTVRTLPMSDQPSPDTLSAKGSSMQKGRYTLRWQVLANDGHITRGEIPFKVE
jgi:methionine-rich copper-binding protein CopC